MLFYFVALLQSYVCFGSLLTWSESQTSLPYSASDHSSALYNNKLWVLGGTCDICPTSYEHSIYTLPSTSHSFLISNLTNNWSQVNTTTNNHTTRNSLLISNYLYIPSFDKLYIFDFTHETYINEQNYSSTIPNPSLYSCNIYIENQQKLFMIGGKFNDLYMNITQIYDIPNDSWHIMDAHLNIARSDFVCEYSSFTDCMYIFSGENVNGTKSVEKYCFNDNNEWILLDIEIPMVGIKGSSSIIINKDIFIIGGEYDNNDHRQWSNNVIHFDINSESFSIDSQLPYAISYFPIILMDDIYIMTVGGIGNDSHPCKYIQYAIISNNSLDDDYISDSSMFNTTVVIDDDKYSSGMFAYWIVIGIAVLLLLFMQQCYRNLRRRRILHALIVLNEMNNGQFNAVVSYPVVNVMVVDDDGDSESYEGKIDQLHNLLNVGNENDGGCDVGEKQSHLCIICMENMIASDEAIQLKCNHLFHKKCAKKWLGENASCPLCRQKVEVKN